MSCVPVNAVNYHFLPHDKLKQVNKPYDAKFYGFGLGCLMCGVAIGVICTYILNTPNPKSVVPYDDEGFSLVGQENDRCIAEINEILEPKNSIFMTYGFGTEGHVCKVDFKAINSENHRQEVEITDNDLSKLVTSCLAWQ
jgi:hypothetical protein